MKITYYIGDADHAGWCPVLRGVWDTTKPIKEAAKGWPCVGAVDPNHILQEFEGTEADVLTLTCNEPLKPGTTITWEEE